MKNADYVKAKTCPLPSGTVVGGYQVIKKLAAGGFGVVYLGEDSDRHLVALKEYLPSSLAERSPGELTPRVKPEKQPLYRLGLKSFFEEGRSLAQIIAPERRLGAELLPRERNRLHGDELPAGRHAAGFHRHRARPQARQGVPREHHPLALRRDPARLAHRAPAQDAAPGHQAGQHLHHQRQQGGAARLRRRARSAEQGRQLHPPDVHAGLRRARDVPPRRHARPVDRHLRHRRLHLRLHAGLPAQRRAAAHRERPARAVALAAAQRLLRQPDRGDRVVHVARPAVPPAKRVRAAERTGARDRAALYQAQLQRTAEAAAREPDDGAKA